MLITKIGMTALAMAAAIPGLASSAAMAGNAAPFVIAAEARSNGERIRTPAPDRVETNAPQNTGNANSLAAPQGNSNQNPGGPRGPNDRIDLSVCELATFDHEKCLGG